MADSTVHPRWQGHLKLSTSSALGTKAGVDMRQSMGTVPSGLTRSSS